MWTNSANGTRLSIRSLVASLLSALLGLTLSSCTGGRPPIDVTTFHNDLARTGQNLAETILTPRNVTPGMFGKIGFFPVDGTVDAQSLYLSDLSLAGGKHNVLYVATAHDSVYAFDADNGSILWKSSLLGSGETSGDDRCGAPPPEMGITATPVIDRKRGRNGAIYLVAMTKDAGGKYYQRIHALDVTTGTELTTPTTINGTFPGYGDTVNGGFISFQPEQYKERAGLLLLNTEIYTTWASHCDNRPYTGWILSFSASNLAPARVFNITPNGYEGAIWMAGAAPAADASGNIYALAGNGTFDTTLDSHGYPSKSDFGNAFLKISTSGTNLSVSDYFEMFDGTNKSDLDADLGSGGTMLLPDMKDNSGKVWHLAVGAGKDANIYVVDRDEMGKYDPTGNNIYQEIDDPLLGGIFSTPSYFNHIVYFGAGGDYIRSFSISDAKLSTSSTTHTAGKYPYPGATTSISANGASDAILWAVENTSAEVLNAVLRAYDATDLRKELYNSDQSGSRDHFGVGNKFIVPTIANGKVYVGTPNGVAVFGLLH